MAIAVANRYARALADVVSDTKGDYRRVLGELESFLAAYRESSDLREVLDTPAVTLEKKLKILDAVAARSGASKIVTNFLRVLVKNYRIGMLGDMCAAFRRIANQRLGIVQVRLISASRLADTEQQALRARFQEVARKQVAMEFHVDTELLGGVVAQIESTVYDGSVRGSLARIREELVKR